MHGWCMASPNKKGITVRFEDHEMAQLEELAARYHVSSSTIIRWALKALCDYVEANGGQITLPLDFSAFYRAAEASFQETARNQEAPAALRVAKSPAGGKDSKRRASS